MQVRARACITRMPTSHPNSVVKHSFPMTKEESPNEDCIVVFLTEKFVQIVDEVVTVKEEKDALRTTANVFNFRYRAWLNPLTHG